MTTKSLERTTFSSCTQRSSGKRIVLINLRYPYGKNRIYLGGWLIVTAARFLEAGCDVEFIDLNIFSIHERLFPDALSGTTPFCEAVKKADYIGISIIGAPSIPDAASLVFFLNSFFPEKQILIGGHVIEQLSSGDFFSIFRGTQTATRQIFQVRDSGQQLYKPPGMHNPLTSPYDISYTPALNRMGTELLRAYLSTEITLVVSQGCKFSCAFCAAAKRQREQHVRFDNFRTDMYYLAARAKEFEIKKLECYASSLDFFQNPEIIIGHLTVLAEVRKNTGIDIKVRCLTCMSSFLQAFEENEELGVLLQNAGVWCIGFGVDGADATVWKSQKKHQNEEYAFEQCAKICEQYDIRAEMLMVIGFPQDTIKTLIRAIAISLSVAFRYDRVMVRPYLAKPFVPGNDGWNASEHSDAIQRLITNPKLFYNLDFCALGSRLTHPRFFHRLLSNLAYLLIIILLTPFGKCCTSPLFPQGEGGIFSWFAKQANKLMPFDR